MVRYEFITHRTPPPLPIPKGLPLQLWEQCGVGGGGDQGALPPHTPTLLYSTYTAAAKLMHANSQQTVQITDT
jgi:hypothetical protein